ncbi:ATP-dependent RNA helicase HrpA [Hamadaea sp. NPDC050747]|uniref:ATP-dependent RNA helicase HrpA n=1 Tax=Hamadaea sp. NPDC050747 TaxID=3155789 RepID=UPI0033E55A7D
MSTPEESRPERPTQRPADGQTPRKAANRRRRPRRPEIRSALPETAADGSPEAPEGGRSAGPERRERRPEKRERRPERRERRGWTPEQIQRRRESVPKIRYPEELPVSQRKDEILAAIRDNQVVIVAGETGSGKTTQLPKICLELGRGVEGMIGHTQPRRLAARTVADRIAEELGVELGQQVGFQVRFGSSVGEQTMVKLMTDGILLAELAHDRRLTAYDTLIIDEAHERSLNIDFILGYLKQLLPSRPDLKVIITSATIETERFAQHFADADGKPAPIIEVSGRTYPVELRYRPLVVEGDEEDTDEVRDQVTAISDAVDELAAEGPGDILVFLSGEREIRDTADALTRRQLRFTEIIPLYARLSTAEQHRVFAPHTGRRIVLATNVAETSLTVPGIKYVIDPGTARISRYSQRLKVQRLPIEPVSQASANQRAGRCGRTSDGIAVRLYSEEEYQSRPEFTDPEILRTNLASVILQMVALRLGEVEDFPFIDPPDRRNIRDGYDLLHELGALTAEGTLTPVGRRLARIPADPRLGRMILAAERTGCLREVLVIAAALSIQDPRERPQDKQQQASQSHARFADKESDFLAYLNLWNYLHEQQQELSGNQFRRLCKSEYLHYLRVREWQDLFGQLRRAVGDNGDQRVAVSAAPDPDSSIDGDAIHQALLAGLLSHIGLYEQEKREYAGARGAKFAIFPGSVLFKRSPRFVMAAELVETSRLWARTVAKIEPEWVEKLADHLVKRSYSEPHWSRKAAAVLAYERVTLYGVPLVVQRRVNFGQIDPPLSRELFIRHALVEGDWDTRHEFYAKNKELLGEVEELESRARRRDILVDDQTLFDFYDARIPADVVSGRHFDSWWKTARRQQPELLTFDPAMLVNAGAGGVAEADFPDVWRTGDHEFPLTYQFEPGTAADGVTVHIPLPALAGLTTEGFDWQIPGLREELVTSLLRGLPKVLRRHFVPVPDHAKYALTQLKPYDGTLLEALGRHLHRLAAVEIPYDAWDLSRIPDYLRMTFSVEDGGKVLATGKDLAAIQEQLRPKTKEVFHEAVSDVEQSGLREFPDTEIPRSVERKRMGYTVKAYPALHDEGDSVGVRLYESEAEQQKAMWRGTRRVLMLNLPFSPVRYLSSRLDNAAKLALSRGPHGSVAALLDDCVACAVDRIIAESGGPAWDPTAFAKLQETVRERLFDAFEEVVSKVELILKASYEIERRLKAVSNIAYVAAVNDIRQQLTGLIRAGFVAETGWWLLPHLQRYLKAIDIRLEKLPGNLQRDRSYTDLIHEIQQEYADVVAQLPPARRAADAVTQIPWMIEELRVSYFAQSMGTAYPISDVRIFRAIDAL